MKTNAIIFIEQNESFRKIVSTHLRQYFFVKEFSHTLTALQYMQLHPCCLVLFSVPTETARPTGFISDVRNNLKLKHLPIIAMIHRHAWEFQEETYRAGADLCLEKPFGVESLSVIIRTAIRNREAAYMHARRMTILPVDYVKIESEDEYFLDRINQYIKSQVSDTSMSVTGMAEAVSLSVSQLDRRLAKLAKCSPKQYIRDYRMKVAFELLAEKRGNVSEVAMLTGFKSVSYFSTKFREHYGYTPSKFRLPAVLKGDFEDDYPNRVA